jgi:hypothetical protein
MTTGFVLIVKDLPSAMVVRIHAANGPRGKKTSKK